MPSPVTGANLAPAPSTQRAGANGQLDKDDFLKLFVAQMQKQDPSQPMDNAAMMGQMASFSTLEQMSNLTKVTEAMALNSGQADAIGLIGRTVTYEDATGTARTGVVEKVSTAGGATVLTVGGAEGIDPGSVTSVTATAPGAPEAPAPAEVPVP